MTKGRQHVLLFAESNTDYIFISVCMLVNFACFLAQLSHRFKVSFCDPMMSAAGKQFALNNISS